MKRRLSSFYCCITQLCGRRDLADLRRLRGRARDYWRVNFKKFTLHKYAIVQRFLCLPRKRSEKLTLYPNNS
jgi:hypothetical protein